MSGEKGARSRIFYDANDGKTKEAIEPAIEIGKVLLWNATQAVVDKNASHVCKKFSKGAFAPGVGGGLCQMSNLIFWMTIHTPLTVIERHRHGYDVFPDSNRTQPFGSGATCYYPHGDLMIQNNTDDTYQLVIHVGEEYLEGEWRVASAPKYRYEIEERNHQMRGEYWGGYSRHNEIYQKQYDLQGNLLGEKLVVKNSAIMMYSPFLENKTE